MAACRSAIARKMPPPYRRPADPDALCHPPRRVPIRRGEHNARPLDVLARPVAVGRDRDQLLTLRVVQNYADLLCHGPQPNAMAQYRTLGHAMNLLNDSVQAADRLTAGACHLPPRHPTASGAS